MVVGFVFFYALPKFVMADCNAHLTHLPEPLQLLMFADLSSLPVILHVLLVPFVFSMMHLLHSVLVPVLTLPVPRELVQPSLLPPPQLVQ